MTAHKAAPKPRGAPRQTIEQVESEARITRFSECRTSAGTCEVIKRRYDAVPLITQILSYGSAESRLWAGVGTGNPVVWSDWRPLPPDSGSNCNGGWMRFADGTQICTSPMFNGGATTAAGSLFRWSASQTWTFPAELSVAPSVVPAHSNNAQAHAALELHKVKVAALSCLNAALAAEAITGTVPMAEQVSWSVNAAAYGASAGEITGLRRSAGTGPDRDECATPGAEWLRPVLKRMASLVFSFKEVAVAHRYTAVSRPKEIDTLYRLKSA